MARYEPFVHATIKTLLLMKTFAHYTIVYKAYQCPACGRMRQVTHNNGDSSNKAKKTQPLNMNAFQKVSSQRKGCAPLPLLLPIAIGIVGEGPGMRSFLNPLIYHIPQHFRRYFPQWISVSLFIFCPAVDDVYTFKNGCGK